MRRAALPLAALAGIWGCSFLFIKVADEGLTWVQVAFARAVLGAGVLATLVAVRRERWPRDPGLWAHLAFLGLVSNALPFCLFAWGEHRVTSSLAGIFNASTPLWTALVALPLLPAAQRLHGRRAAGLALGFLGVVIVFAPWQSGTGSLGGDLACLAAGLCYGVALVHTRRRVQGRASSLVLAAGQLSCASVELAIGVLAVGLQAPVLTGRLVASVLALGALGTGVAYLLFFGLIAEIGPTRASTVTYLVPLVAVTLGVTALGDRLTTTTVLGGLVLLAGVGLTSVPSGRATADRSREPGHNRAERVGMGPPTVRT